MKTKTLVTKCLASFVGLAITSMAYSQALPPVQDTPDGPFYMPGELLIKFRADVTDQEFEQVVRLAGVTSARQIHTAVMKARGDIGITRAFTGRPVAQAIRALQNHPGIHYAEPNWVYHHQTTDPFFADGSLWGMYGDMSYPANSFGSQAAEAWAGGYTGSPNVIVGVIDEGIQISHLDLADNIWLNPIDSTINKEDEDNNGYEDDIHGWDFVNNDNSVYDSGGDYHGTHVSGTIGAVGNNGLGVVGVNWAVSIISGKFLGPEGGSTTDAIEAVDYFTDLKQREVNVIALNNSWGGGGYSQSLHDAIIRAAKAGILFVAAAGNGNFVGRAINTDKSAVYPSCYNTTVGTTTEQAASYDSVISVTAIDSTGNKASWANYGAKTVDIGAPGVNIFSTLPENVYGSYSGTSMATPHVTGAIALYASTHPNATAGEIKAAILSSALPTASLAGKTVTGGRLDLSSIIVGEVNNNPPEIEPVSSVSGDEDTSVKFTASASDVDGDPLTYTWNFGDGNTAATEFPDIIHTYVWGATFVVTVTVTDGKGGSATAETSATIMEVNDEPVANAGGPYIGVVDTAVTFDGTGSYDYDNQDGTTANYQPLTYTWDFGDGSSSDSSLEPTSIHTYTVPDDYTVTLTVSDGVASSSATATVTVTAEPPPASIQLTATGYKVKGRQNVDLQWSGSSAASVTIWRNGAELTTTANDVEYNEYTDAIGAVGGGTYNYQIKDGEGNASNIATVVF